MKRVLNIFFFALLINLVTSCSNEESRLENKWQLRRYEHANGAVQREDSVFYNFMSESFSAICLLSDGSYTTIFGNYTFNGSELMITVLPESASGPIYERYLNWKDGSRIFHVDELSSSTLQLNYNGDKSIFRKY
ncbi:lipocalin-like domain-containing protein [uncultured Bacteroides sp.]|jgi:hypothetical protein|uniref:lipocalin-like domain-containing protein n=1 Tax=uncultured Bacteroides sp. TaxID=162156 RepID=UPI002AA8B248|nr:lipocalin-like domain-containing protein [uncultured Bacteroides sp.]